MSRQTRRLSDPPDYYYELNSKQQANWRRNTKRIEHNEELREQYPPFQSPSRVTIVHIHYRTPVETVDRLIWQARRTTRYAIDSESQMIDGQATGALVQVEFIHSTEDSTVVLFETRHLPEKNSFLFTSIEELCLIIFDENNEIISWGTLENELKNFRTLGLFKPGNHITEINLQDRFSGWYKQKESSHPAGEKRGERTWSSKSNIFDSPGVDNPTTARQGSDREEQRTIWSLQDAIASTFKEFLDKSETNGKWTCGLDQELGTWKMKIFSKDRYNPMEEKEKRSTMIRYAIDDCLAVSRLYFCMNSANKTPDNRYEIRTTNFNRTPPISRADELKQILFPRFDRQLPTNTLMIQTTTNRNRTVILSREDELKQIFIPRFDRHPSTLPSSNNDSNILTINPTSEEMNEFQQNRQDLTDEQLAEQKRAKSERQKRKNQKLKWKQQNLPHFQHKIKRPIYYQYDFRKIRAQLSDDKVNTSHQITINRRFSEVVIGFKSQDELERATRIVKINYFSKNQYNDRWG